MAAKRAKKQWVIRGRVIGNSGAIALVECTDDTVLQIIRGHTFGVRDMFRNEFLSYLCVGRALRVTSNGSECTWEVVSS